MIEMSKEKFFKIKRVSSKLVDNAYVFLKNTSMGKALLINFCIFSALNIISYATYQCNIDIMMQTLINNVGGIYQTSHVAYINICITKILIFLGSLFPSVAWYTWFIEIFSFFGITLLGKIVLERHKDSLFTAIVVVFDIFVGYDCYIFPSYIKSATVLAFAGFMLLYDVYINEGRNKSYIVPVVIIILSSMISMTGFYSGTLGAVTIIAFQIIINHELKGNIGTAIIFLIISFVLPVLLHQIDNQFYRMGPDGEIVALEYRTDIEKVLVFGYPDYNQEWEDTYGITEDNYNYLVNYDEFLVKKLDFESTAFFKALSVAKIKFNWDNLLEFFRTVLINQINVWIFYLWLISLFVIANIKSDRKMLVIVAEIVFWTVSWAVFYFSYAWKCNVAELMIYIPLIYLNMLNIRDVDELSCRDFILGMIILGVVLYGKFSANIVTSVNDKAEIEKQFEENYLDDNTYVINIYRCFKGYSAYVSYPENVLEGKRILIMNGYYLMYPNMDIYRYVNHYDEEILWGQDAWLNPDLYYVME